MGQDDDQDDDHEPGPMGPGPWPRGQVLMFPMSSIFDSFVRLLFNIVFDIVSHNILFEQASLCTAAPV